jgi:hypothetical protein
MGDKSAASGRGTSPVRHAVRGVIARSRARVGID